MFAVKLTGVGGGYGNGSRSYSSYLAGGRSPIGGHNGTGIGMGPAVGKPQLMVLSEQTPALTLYDVLQDCECLREDRARVSCGYIYIYQSEGGFGLTCGL